MNSEPWHLSKSVPLSIIFAVIVQTVTLVWFIAGLNASIENNAREPSYFCRPYGREYSSYTSDARANG